MLAAEPERLHEALDELNKATLPLAEQSTFIRSYFDRGFYYPPGVIMPDLHSIQLLDPVKGLLKAFGTDEITSYQDVISRSH